MRQLKDAALRPITLSEIERLKEAGYQPLAAGDASKANSDYFMVMVRERTDATATNGMTREVVIVCPSFLRGTLSMSKVQGGFGY